MLLSSHLTPSTSRSSRTQLTSLLSCDLSAPRPAAARRPPIFSPCCPKSLWRRGGGWSEAAQYEPKYCLNKISGNFRIQIFFMFHVNLHVQHRNHIFTIMSGISRAMQPLTYSNAIGRHKRRHNVCAFSHHISNAHAHHNSTPTAHMATLIHASTHSHALSHCNHSSCIVSHINEAATEYMKTKLQKSQENALQNQINKGKRHEAFLLSSLLLLTLLWQILFHDLSYNHCR